MVLAETYSPVYLQGAFDLAAAMMENHSTWSWRRARDVARFNSRAHCVIIKQHLIGIPVARVRARTGLKIGPTGKITVGIHRLNPFIAWL